MASLNKTNKYCCCFFVSSLTERTIAAVEHAKESAECDDTEGVERSMSVIRKQLSGYGCEVIEGLRYHCYTPDDDCDAEEVAEAIPKFSLLLSTITGDLSDWDRVCRYPEIFNSTHTHVCTHAGMHAGRQVGRQADRETHTHIHTYTHTYIYILIYIYIYIKERERGIQTHIHIYMCVYICVYIYIYIYRERERERERERRERERESDIYTQIDMITMTVNNKLYC